MPATRISIATFNLLNLSAVNQTTHSGSTPLDQDTFDKKINWIAEKLQDINADLIGFQEVWSRNALLACFEKAGLQGKYQIIARDAQPGLVQVAARIDNARSRSIRYVNERSLIPFCVREYGAGEGNRPAAGRGADA